MEALRRREPGTRPPLRRHRHRRGHCGARRTGDLATEGAVRRLEPATAEQERQAEEIAELEDCLEQQRRQDWAAYGRALQTAIETQAARLSGLTVPVLVRLEPATSRWGNERAGAAWGLVDRLLRAAIQATALPGDGRPPLAPSAAVAASAPATSEATAVLIAAFAQARRTNPSLISRTSLVGAPCRACRVTAPEGEPVRRKALADVSALAR